jgi:hypothetical protein|nr:MAG TPA: hypothetical protein [Caudoviricetes sp.]
MAERAIYVTVRLSISNPGMTESSDEEVDHIISEVGYEFKNVENYQISTEIWDTSNSCN